MWKIDISMQHSSATLRYGVAVLGVIAALGLTLLVHPDALQSPIFFLAIILSAWIGGTGPGLVAAALSTLALAYFFLPPLSELKLDARYTTQLLVFFFSALLISSWSAARGLAEQKLRRTRNELEVEVQQRTAELSRSNELLQEAFRETQALRDRLRLVIDEIPVMVWSAPPDGTPDFFNRRFLQYFGLSIQGADRKSMRDLIHPDDLARTLETWNTAVATAQPYEHEQRVRRADGAYRWCVVRGVPLRDQQGNIVRWYGTTFDIHDRKCAEENQQQSEAYLSEAQRLSHTGSFGWNLRTGEILWSEETFRIFQYERTTVPTVEIILQRTHPEDARHVQQTIEQASQDGRDFDIEHRLLMPDGSVKHLRVVAHAERNMSGERAFVGAVMDVTDAKEADERQRRAEQSLQKSEAYSAEAQRLSHTGSIGWNVANGECFWSEETFRIYQIDRATPLTAETILQRTHPDDFALVRQNMESALQVGQEIDFEHRLLMPDGAVKHVHVVSHPVFDAAGDLAEYVGSVVDVTEHKQAAEALKSSKDCFRAMVEKSIEGIALVRRGMDVIYASASVERVLGYPPDEFRALRLNDLLHPDFQQLRTDAWAQLLQDPDHDATAELLVRHKDGTWRWIESNTRNMLNEPSVQAVVVNFRDITERKLAHAERERLEQRLRQAEKMEAVGRLAGGIAHDFNNVLAGIFAYGEMLFEETPGDSPLKRYARNVLIAATRGRALVDQILAYSSSRRGKRAPVDIVHVVDETLELVRGSLPADIHLEARAPERPLVVIGDATQLHQVVTNLCSNAIQAMSGGGTLRVTLEIADLSAERALSHGTLHPGRYVRLTVADSGSGMDEATLAHIFEPFFTTKDIGRGTGLGLSLVYAIVTDSGGAIDVQSAPGQGTTITIYGPLAEVALAAADETAVPPPRGRGERVLLIDDEAPLLAATAEVLARLGYEPVSFSDSHAALAAFEATPERFDVVVTDEVMPGLTGTGLANVVRRHRPELPIVLLSGYSGAILTQQALAAGVSELLVKPLQSREIATTLTRVLNRTD